MNHKQTIYGLSQRYANNSYYDNVFESLYLTEWLLHFALLCLHWLCYG